MKFVIPDNIKKLMKTLVDAKFECYIIGGALRDYYLNVVPHDYDLFTNATGTEIVRLFPEGVIIGNKARQEKILTVIVDGVEISQYRANGKRDKVGTSLKRHLKTCDFTINSIASDIKSNIIDLHGGIDDIKNKIIRAVGRPLSRFKEDPLRILRGVRFHNKYGCTIENKTLTAMHNTQLLDSLPKERIREEFLKILPYGLNQHDILFDSMLPIFLLGNNINGGPHHGDDETIFSHSMKTYKNMLVLTDNPLLLMTALFHDIGKITAVKTNSNGSNSFYNHEIKGKTIIKNWMKEYAFGNNDIRYVTSLIKHHMYTSTMSKKGYLKLFSNLEINCVPIQHLLYLRYADSQGNSKNARYKIAEKNDQMMKTYYKLKYTNEPFNVSDLEINGHDVMKYGYEKEAIGAKLREVLNLIQENEIENKRPELLAWLKNDK